MSIMKANCKFQYMTQSRIKDFAKGRKLSQRSFEEYKEPFHLRDQCKKEKAPSIREQRKMRHTSSHHHHHHLARDHNHSGSGIH